MAGEEKSRDEVDAVIRDVRPIVVQVLDARPSAPHRQLDHGERNDWEIDHRRPQAREAISSPQQPREGREIQQRQREQVGEEPEMRPREAVEAREEGGEEGEEALVEGRRQGQAGRDYRSEAGLKRGGHPKSSVVQVQPASQLEVLDRRAEQRRAREQGDRELPNALHDEAAISPRLEGSNG